MINILKKTIFNWYVRFGVTLPKGKKFLNRILVRIGTAIYNIDGVKLRLNPVSTVDRNLITAGIHDPFVKEIIEHRLSLGGIFIDIGANIGYFSIVALKNPNTFTIAFEPSPRELIRLYQNIIENNCQNRVIVFPIILSDENRNAQFFISPMENPGKNSILNRAGSSLLKEMIPARRFDHLIHDNLLTNVRVVKIDVEGAEIKVLEGIGKAISKMDDVVFIVEISPSLLVCSGKTADDIYMFFKKHGFTWQRGPRFSEQYDELFFRRSQ